MIVVTVGTQFFDELVLEVDRLVEQGVIRDRVWAQIGLARTPPRHLDFVAFDRRLVQKAAAADLIITHAGTGSVCELLPLRRPMIAVVNPTKAGNHQLEFVQQLSQSYDFCWIPSPRQLAETLPHARPPRALTTSTLPALAGAIDTALVSR